MTLPFSRSRRSQTPAPVASACALLAALLTGSARAQDPPAPSPEVASPDPFSQHVEQARALMDREQYLQALRELEAAYALRQPPSLLLTMGQAHQRLGNQREALQLYQRYLMTGAGTPQERAQAEAGVRLLSQLLPTVRPPGEDIPPPERPRSRRLGLMAGGAALFGSSYLAAVLTGSILMNDCGYASYSSSSRDRNCKMGGTLLVPFLGPFISAGISATPTWSVPWAMIGGVAQLGGLAMMIVASRQPAQRPSPAGLVAGGASLFGSAYLGAVLGASFTISTSRGTAGGVLLIPVLGPFISAVVHQSPDWSISWALVDGVAQASGLALMVLGGVRLRSQAPARVTWNLEPLPTAGGSGLAVTGTF